MKMNGVLVTFSLFVILLTILVILIFDTDMNYQKYSKLLEEKGCQEYLEQLNNRKLPDPLIFNHTGDMFGTTNTTRIVET